MKNEGELENTIYDYGTQFGNNVNYYLEKIFGIVISYQDPDSYHYDELHGEKIYPNDMNEDVLDNVYNEYYNWVEKNKEKLGLTED